MEPKLTRSFASSNPLLSRRGGRQKLLEYYEGGMVQLFNLKEDIGEQIDLSDREPGKAAELTEMLHRWRESTGARMMEPNPDYKYDERKSD